MAMQGQAVRGPGVRKVPRPASLAKGLAHFVLVLAAVTRVRQRHDPRGRLREAKGDRERCERNSGAKVK